MKHVYRAEVPLVDVGFSALDVEPMDEARGDLRALARLVGSFSALDVEPMDEAASLSAAGLRASSVSVLLMSSRWMKPVAPPPSDTSARRFQCS